MTTTNRYRPSKFRRNLESALIIIAAFATIILMSEAMMKALTK